MRRVTGFDQYCNNTELYATDFYFNYQVYAPLCHLRTVVLELPHQFAIWFQNFKVPRGVFWQTNVMFTFSGTHPNTLFVCVSSRSNN